MELNSITFIGNNAWCLGRTSISGHPGIHYLLARVQLKRPCIVYAEHYLPFFDVLKNLTCLWHCGFAKASMAELAPHPHSKLIMKCLVIFQQFTQDWLRGIAADNSLERDNGTITTPRTAPKPSVFRFFLNRVPMRRARKTCTLNFGLPL